jgi:DNA-binding NtrC family response regulator
METESTIKVLIVEDEYINAWALANAIKPFASVRHAATKDETLYWIRREKFQFVLLDIRLGQASEAGIELLPEIKKIQPDCLVFATTGYGTVHDEDRYLGMGFDAFYPKPVDEGRMIYEIQNFLNSRRVA